MRDQTAEIAMQMKEAYERCESLETSVEPGRTMLLEEEGKEKGFERQTLEFIASTASGSGGKPRVAPAATVVGCMALYAFKFTPIKLLNGGRDANTNENGRSKRKRDTAGAGMAISI